MPLSYVMVKLGIMLVIMTNIIVTVVFYNLVGNELCYTYV